MNFVLDLLNLTVKSSLLLAWVWLVCLAFGRASASTRHLIWALGMAGVLALTLAAVLLPSWFVVEVPGLPGPHLEPTVIAESADRVDRLTAVPGIPPSPRTGTAAAADRATAGDPPAERRDAWHGWLALIWLGGSALALGALAIGLVRVFSVVRGTEPIRDPEWIEQLDLLAARLSVAEPVELLRSDRAVSPMTFGIRRARIVLPADCDEWSAPKRHDVLTHELAHVRRRDCLTQLLPTAVCVVYWFNPLAWLAARRMRLEQERACDDGVLLVGTRPSSYAANLLEIACTLRVASATTMARRPEITERVTAVLDPGQRRGAPGRRALAAGVAFVGLGAVVLLSLGIAGPVVGAPAAGPARSAGASEPYGVPPTARPALEAGQREIASALERRNAAAVAALYTEDARAYLPLWGELRGRAAIENYWRESFGAGLSLSSETLETYGSDETAYEIGRFAVRDATGTFVARGKYITLWKRDEDGAFRIYRDVGNMSSAGLSMNSRKGDRR